MDPLTSWSLDFIAAMQQIHPALHLFFGAFTFLGQPQFYVVMLPLLLWCVDVRLGARVGIFLLLSSQLNTVLKDLFHQPRPSDFDPSLQLAWFEGYGLPSGHAQFVVVFWGAIAAWARRPWLWVLVVLLAVLVGFSRVYLGVHFPQDIVAGWAIGGLSLALYLAVQGGLERRLAELELHWQILLAASAPLVLFVTSPGKSVAYISPVATENLGTVSYLVRVGFDPTQVPLRSGMTANITIVTERRENVLLMPSRAISADRATGLFYVERLRGDGETERVEVEIGIQDSTYTEVLRGLEEGDQLVIGGVTMRDRLRMGMS